MPSVFAAALPHILNRAIAGFAWTAAPLWLADIAAAAAGLPDRCVVLLTGGAVAGVACALRVWHEEKVDARITLGLEAHQRHEAELALLTGTMFDSGLVKTAPIPQPGQAPDLRLLESS